MDSDVMSREFNTFMDNVIFSKLRDKMYKKDHDYSYVSDITALILEMKKCVSELENIVHNYMIYDIPFIMHEELEDMVNERMKEINETKKT